VNEYAYFADFVASTSPIGPSPRSARHVTAATPAYFSIDGKRDLVLDRNVELTLVVPGPASAAAA
jgi:hypothetical protein